LATKAVAIGSFQLLVERLDGVDGSGLQGAAQSLAAQLGDGAAVVLGGLPDPSDQGKVILVAAFGKDVIAAKQQAGKFIGAIRWIGETAEHHGSTIAQLGSQALGSALQTRAIHTIQTFHQQLKTANGNGLRCQCCRLGNC
jgi:alanyl-tRNA synthetase